MTRSDFIEAIRSIPTSDLVELNDVLDRELDDRAMDVTELFLRRKADQESLNMSYDEMILSIANTGLSSH